MNNNTRSLFEIICNLLDNENKKYSVSYQDKDDKDSKIISVYLKNNQEKEALSCEILFYIDSIVEPPYSVFNQSENDLDRVYFNIKFISIIPIQFDKSLSVEILKTVSLFNSVLEIPGFVYHEREGIVSFCYMWMIARDFFNETIFLNIIGLHELVLDIYTPQFDAINDGFISFDKLKHELIKTGQIPKIPRLDPTVFSEND